MSDFFIILIFICFSLIGGSDYKLIYRHYATLYFVFCVDSSESELGILDLIQVSCCILELLCDSYGPSKADIDACRKNNHLVLLARETWSVMFEALKVLKLLQCFTTSFKDL